MCIQSVDLMESEQELCPNKTKDESSSSSNCSSSVVSSTTTPLTTSSKPKLPSSKYKGVVPQPNGRWGAQLYVGHLRIWLGTFDRQDQAAQAYDIAAIKFRGPHAISNLPIHHYSRPHLEFLGSLSKAQVVDMLRGHTYYDELARFMRIRIAKNPQKRTGWGCSLVEDPDHRERLFQKVLTPSDVGKLHRLVIPRCHAERHLPSFVDDDGLTGMMLTFEDVSGSRVWRFKYRYWSSSQNYVLTKGWPQFVKDKGLKAGDVVTFFSSIGPEKQLYIESRSRPFVPNEAELPTSRSSATGNSHLDLDDFGGGGDCGSDYVDLVRSSKLRLFGVDICPMIPVSISTPT